jgi:Cof subfamily protein (haloacid dehalogenase superfamily)
MNNKIQMIVTDLDRSLLHTDKSISKYTKKILEKCKNMNISIVFATARPVRSTKIYMEEINPNAVIYHNGAIITAEQTILKYYGILPQKARKLLVKIEREYPEVTLSVETDDTLYTNFDLDTNLGYKKINFADLPETAVEKIIIGNMPIEKIKKEIDKYITNDLYLEINDSRFGFIMNKKASKWNGIKELSEYYKISVDKIVAFGDDLNDLEMIKRCGIGITMENGLDEVKKEADYICENNDKDGIAKWLEENIIKKRQNCT